MQVRQGSARTAQQRQAAGKLERRLQQAMQFHRLGRLDQAEKLYRQIVRKAPQHPAAHHFLSVIALGRGRFAEAEKLIRRALTIQPEFPEALCNHGLVLGELGRVEEALASFDKAVALRPDFAEAFNNRGEVLRKAGRPTEAVEDYGRALAIRRDFAEAANNRGVALYEANRFEDAIASLDGALVIAPDYAEAWTGRGAALAKLGRLDEALASYDRALEIRPGHLDALINRGVLLKELERFDEALAEFDRAQKLDPGNASAHYNESLCRLLIGDFARAWPKYEYRPAKTEIEAARRFRRPQWHGAEPLAGRTILLHSEQGLGDTIQFCRYAEPVAGLGATVILEVQPALASLLGTIPGVDQVIAQGDTPPAFDFQCPLMSLPLAFGTSLDTVPARNAYLSADERKIAHWSAVIGEPTRPRIGIVWSGNPRHGNDHNRSIPLSLFGTILALDADFFGLQKDIRPEDAAILPTCPALRPMGDRLADFQDTAALASLMDVVVSVDTSVAHLAAALGRPTWVLLPRVPDWRWLLDRDDSPWYPTMRLFRQPRRQDWKSVLSAVQKELQAYLDLAAG